MKQRRRQRYPIALLLALSLFSTLYVNFDAASLKERADVKSAITEQQAVNSQELEREAPHPTNRALMISRLLHLLQRIVSNPPRSY